jgi:hypothetical protein
MGICYPGVKRLEEEMKYEWVEQCSRNSLNTVISMLTPSYL